MTQRIIIYLHATDVTHASWVVTDDAGNIIQSIAEGDITTLTPTAESEVYVIIPEQDILLTTAPLPKLSRQRLLQALPFALEDQLIDDVTDLHFAIGEYQTDGTLPVAIVSKEKMDNWLAQFVQLKLAPRAFIPAIFILPFSTTNVWHINSYNNIALVRTGKLTGFACEQENLNTFIELKLAEIPDSGSIHLERSEFSEQQLLEKQAHGIASLPYINLLQGEYRPKPQTTQVKNHWLRVCYLIIACVALAFVGKIGSYFILHHEVNKIDTAINQIYKRNFPKATSIVAPHDRMAEKLRSLSGQASKNNFLALLGIIGKTLNETPGVHIQNLDFRDQQLMLELTGDSFDNIDSLMKRLTQQGLTVKQQNSAMAGSEVKATLLIRAGA